MKARLFRRCGKPSQLMDKCALRLDTNGDMVW